MRNQPTANPKTPRQEKTYNFAHNLELAGWLMSLGREQDLDEINLFASENGETLFVCFIRSKEQSELDFTQYLKYKTAHPEECRRAVKAGLKKMSNYLNRLIRAERKCAALNKIGEVHHG